ncbi:uncharacterized protein MKK02DRAFT_42203 [Dioszegia hungarica]|uniref:Uncharacterized protein n=1 Tax=Dioszegia hungarica TaxID=4972 RepID=A0AA38LVY6_9TREE|nr:uncharacterized protein MKK02DRAFT_42203 [Dioszegia hungarica]KAI9637830.1 hypothetical protein MKK02DRAFT_42203 [Dioszegia hungarica]
MARPSSSLLGSILAGPAGRLASAPRAYIPRTPLFRSSGFHSTPLRLRAPPVPSTHAAVSPARPVLGTGMNGAAGSAGSASAAGKKKSAHIVWYREIVPAMVPILLLSTTLFLLLALSRTHLSSERTLSDSQSQIAALERQLHDLRQDAKRRLEKERKERERMLPLVVERVLTKVGAMRGGVEEDEEREREEGRRRDERERALLA